MTRYPITIDVQEDHIDAVISHIDIQEDHIDTVISLIDIHEDHIDTVISHILSPWAKGTGTAVFTVRPKRLGEVAIQVSGRTAADVGYADAVRRTVRIEPEGFPQYEVRNSVINRDAAAAAAAGGAAGAAESIKLGVTLPSSGVGRCSLILSNPP